MYGCATPFAGNGPIQRPHPGSALSVRIGHTRASVRQAWHQLENEGHFYCFQSYAWVSTLLETVGLGLGVEPVFLLISHESGTPVMLAPLAVTRRSGMTLLQFIDFGLADYNAPLLHRSLGRELTRNRFMECWRAALDMIGPVDAVRLDKMPSHINGSANPFLHLGCHEHANSHQAVLKGDFSGFLKSRSSNMLADARRKRRRLAEKGKLEFCIAQTPGRAELFASAMIRFKSRRYRATRVDDMFERRAYRDFYLELAREGAADGIVNVSALTLDGSPIAVHWGVVSQNRFYWLMPAFDLDRWWSYSVGRLLLQDLIGWCYEQRVSTFDFTIGNEPYKSQWADQSMPLHIHCVGSSAIGRAYAGLCTHFVKMRQSVRQRPSLHRAIKTIHSKVQQRWWVLTFPIFSLGGA